MGCQLYQVSYAYLYFFEIGKEVTWTDSNLFLKEELRQTYTILQSCSIHVVLAIHLWIFLQGFTVLRLSLIFTLFQHTHTDTLTSRLYLLLTHTCSRLHEQHLICEEERTLAYTQHLIKVWEYISLLLFCLYILTRYTNTEKQIFQHTVINNTWIKCCVKAHRQMHPCAPNHMVVWEGCRGLHVCVYCMCLLFLFNTLHTKSKNSV